MVIQEPEHEIPLIDKGFFWFFTEDDYIIDPLNSRKLTTRFNIDTPMWLPSSAAEAYKWYMYSPNAAPLRSRSGLLQIGKVSNTPYEGTKGFLNEEPKPDDWHYTELIDISDRMPMEPDYEGYVVEGPISSIFKVIPKDNYELHKAVKQISAIYSNMMSPNEIKALSGDRIMRHTSVYEVPKQSKTAIPDTPSPIHGGVADLRLGSYDLTTCYTCGHTGNEKNNKTYTCPGHFGRINLAVPVPNYLYLTGDIDASPLVKTLKYTCRSCHKVVLPDEYLDPLIDNAKKVMYENKTTSPEGFAIIWKALNDAYNAYYKEAGTEAKWGPYQRKVGGGPTPLSTRVNHCPHCDELSPILMFKMKFGWGKQAEFFPKPGKRDKDLFPRRESVPYGEVYDSLVEVPNDHALVMAYNTELDPRTEEPRSHPGYLFWRYFPVSPNQSRPPQEAPNGGLEMNDLSKLYINVIRANHILLDLSTDKGKSKRSESILFKACTQALSSQTSFGSPEAVSKFGSSGVITELLQGVYDRIKPPGEKKNHVRRINQSKVSEHTMYSTITPNAALRIDEVGVPIGACIRLTIGEKVTKANIARLREAVIRGHPDEEKGIVALDDIDIENHFGGAKSIQKPGPHKGLISLSEKVNGALDPFGLDEGGNQADPEAQTVWFREIRSSIEARYRLDEDIHRPPLKEALERAMREYKHNFAREQRTKDADMLKVNDIVHRSLLEHDTILFTRAPALHRQNIMAGKVIPLKQLAFSFNPTICIPFNADYDGDAMRCFVPQSPEAIQEAKDILDVNKQIIHSRYGRPTIASDQDETSGAYLLTFPNTSKLVYKGKNGQELSVKQYLHYIKTQERGFKPEEWKLSGTYNKTNGIGYDDEGRVYFNKKAAIGMLGLVYTRDDEGNLKYMTSLPEPDFGEFYTGKCIVSHFIPDGINCDWEEEDGPVSIRNGQLRSGTLGKNGIKSGSMVLGAAFIYHFNYELGIRKLADFVDHINRLFFAAHLYVGYTMGITDISFADRVSYKHNETDEEITVGELEGLLRTGEGAGYLRHNSFNAQKTVLYDEANEKIRILNEAFFNKTLEELPDEYFLKHSRHWLTYDPLGWVELKIADITNEFDKTLTADTKELQGTANAMNIAVVSGARAGDLNILQMSGAYAQVRVGGTRLISGTQVGRLLPHYSGGYSTSGSYEELADPEFESVVTTNPVDYSGKAFGFSFNSYADGLGPEEYFLASIAGRRSMMESSTGAIQVSGYLSHRLKRSSENLMVDDRGYLINMRMGKVLSLQVGEDGLQPFHARGPDNPDGISLSLQPHFLAEQCNHGITLKDVCDTCQRGTPIGKSQKLGRLPKNISSKLTEKLVLREIAEPTAYFARAYEYYTESKARPGEMIGSTGAANVGEPVTQAGLRAFHGGGKGTVPTTDRIVQLLDLSQSAIKQPLTVFYLKEEYNFKEHAEKMANFCSTLLLDDITSLFKYIPEERAIDILFDDAVVETFQANLGFVQEYLSYKGKAEGFTINEIEGGLRATFTTNEFIDINSYLLLMKESLSKYQINGLVNGGRAFAAEYTHPTKTTKQWCVMVKGPTKPKPGKSNPMMENAYELMGEYYDEYLTVCNDPFWIAHEYGLEAALSGIKEIFYNQMNAPKVGLGQLDIRYIDALIDNMGSTGYLTGLAKSGHMVSTSTSLIGGIGGEDPGLSLRAHPLMGTKDNLDGMVEAITAGRTLSIGKSYSDKKPSSE